MKHQTRVLLVLTAFATSLFTPSCSSEDMLGLGLLAAAAGIVTVCVASTDEDDDIEYLDNLTKCDECNGAGKFEGGWKCSSCSGYGHY